MSTIAANRAVRTARRRLVVLVTLSAIAVAAVSLRLHKTSTANETGIATLVDATGELNVRLVEGRLSGGFRHAPRANRAALSTETADQWRTRITAAIHSNHNSAPLHTTGIAQLLLGNSRASVGTLMKAAGSSVDSEPLTVINASHDPALLNDLSVALFARWEASRQPQDLLSAAEAAEAAWDLRQTAETAWNRALALEALRLRQQAITAWTEAASLESSVAWRDEAATRIARLRAPGAAEAWTAIRSDLGKNAMPLRSDIVRDFAQKLREYVEDSLLAAWAQSDLAPARQIAAALEAHSGESLPRRSIDAIDRASQAHRHFLAAGHREYIEARKLLGHQRMRDAASAFAEAERHLARGASPFASRATLYRATAEYYAGDLNAALDRLRAILADRTLAASSPSLHAQAHWVIGLIHTARANWNEALGAYEVAARSFERGGERENHARVSALIAELLTYVGSGGDAWPHRMAALDELFARGTNRAHAILREAADASSNAGAIRVALRYHSELVGTAKTTNDPVSLADAFTVRSMAGAERGKTKLAMSDLEHAQRLIATIADEVMHVKMEANHHLATATVLRHIDPSRARAAASEAILRMQQIHMDARVIELLYERARAARALGDIDAVLADCAQAIQLIERQRNDLPARDRKRAFLDHWHRVFGLAIATLADRGDHDTAFQYAEQSRGRSYRGVPQRAIRPAAITAVLRDAAVVEYAITDERLLIWVIDSRGTTFRRMNVGRRSIDTLVARIDEAVKLQSVERFDAAVGEAHRILIEPIQDVLPERLIVVPEGALYRIPFAALHGKTRRRIVEDYEISIIPAAAMLLDRGGTSRAASAIAVIGDTAPEIAGEELQPLPAARREIAAVAAIYSRFEVVAGAAATRARVFDALKRNRSAHFAGHAAIPPHSVSPALVLSHDARNGHSGYVYPSDLESLDLDGDLVVLAGCATGWGARSSDGPSSLARAFLMAGFRTVVATQWPVEDDATAGLMVRFHRRVQRGDSPAAALRAVQIEELQRFGPSHDWTWSAFHVLTTEGGERND